MVRTRNTRMPLSSALRSIVKAVQNQTGSFMLVASVRPTLIGGQMLVASPERTEPLARVAFRLKGGFLEGKVDFMSGQQAIIKQTPVFEDIQLDAPKYIIVQNSRDNLVE